ncbi:4-(cytidine 5'-diphospho)-2-C-methyl-D-erythritol kinase [Xanthobacter sp. TB0139]|uniref:4-(cytidine 5'-diphospho)-2-C-methyl-D-erythritol kinase n=1 Tax=Xanthobacter sp. TB0139 TaxID=3459178 RepID=UPI004039847B
MDKLVARAPAKINLTLRVTARRTDGFHELVSLVAFAGTADLLSLEPDQPLALHVDGPMAEAAGPDEDNLVLRAAQAFARLVPGARMGGFRLVKRLPVAAGLGGGSADAAAALRLLARLNGLEGDDPRLFSAAAHCGADVPVCVDPRARLMGGVGERLSAPLELPRLAGVLVNCRVPVPTADVFRALALRAGEDLPGPTHPTDMPQHMGELIALLSALPNDLEPPAKVIAPQIGRVMDLLAAQPEALLVRMSGSGATAFALVKDCHAAAVLARRIAAAQPEWWVRPTILR